MSATTNRFELITLEKLQEIYDILSTSPPGAAVWGTITGTLSSQLDLQAALNAKITSNPSITPGTATKVTYDAKGLVTSGTAITASDLPFGIDAAKIGTGTVDDTEFEFLDGVTGYIQTQINSKYDASNPSGYITSAGVTINKSTVTDGTPVTGTTVSTLTASVLIPANTVATGDILYVKTRVRKTGTAGTLVTRMYVNTSSAIGGSLVGTSAPAAATSLYFQYTRTLAVKSATNTETMAGNGNVNPDDNTSLSVAVSTNNINWTVNQYLVVAVQNGSTADTSRSSFIHAQVNKA